MSRLVYPLGANGDHYDRLGVDCPSCSQTARVELHGRRLSLQCFAGCAEERVAAGLDLGAVTRELVRIGGAR